MKESSSKWPADRLKFGTSPSCLSWPTCLPLHFSSCTFIFVAPHKSTPLIHPPSIFHCHALHICSHLLCLFTCSALHLLRSLPLVGCVTWRQRALNSPQVFIQLAGTSKPLSSLEQWPSGSIPLAMTCKTGSTTTASVNYISSSHLHGLSCSSVAWDFSFATESCRSCACASCHWGYLPWLACTSTGFSACSHTSSMATLLAPWSTGS